MQENKNNIEEEATETGIPAEEAEADVAGEIFDEVLTEENETDIEDEIDEKPSRGEKKKVKKLEAEISELEKKLKSTESEFTAMSDKYMRIYAEYDNFRRRSAKEKESIYADAYIDALSQILPILDNLERAAGYADAADSQIAKGMEMTLKSFADTLTKMGITEIEALGKEFDPNLHEAVLHMEDENAGENEVVEVLVKGYIRGERIIRHSVVKVAN